MIPLLGAKLHPVTRYDVTYTDGLPTKTATDTLEVWASIQPMSQFRMERAPEGLRATHGIVIYASTSVELRTQEDPTPGAPGAPPDEVEFQGLTYQIWRKDPWEFGLPHRVYEAYASTTGREVAP